MSGREDLPRAVRRGPPRDRLAAAGRAHAGAEQARGETQAMAAEGVDPRGVAGQVAVIVDALRALLEEETRRAEEGRPAPIGGSRGLGGLAAHPPEALHTSAACAPLLGQPPPPGSAPRRGSPQVRSARREGAASRSPRRAFSRVARRDRAALGPVINVAYAAPDRPPPLGRDPPWGAGVHPA